MVIEAQIADLVLTSSAAFTEQNDSHENLEGKFRGKKASYPIGDALEDWKIFNLV